MRACTQRGESVRVSRGRAPPSSGNAEATRAATMPAPSALPLPRMAPTTHGGSSTTTPSSGVSMGARPAPAVRASAQRGSRSAPWHTAWRRHSTRRRADRLPWVLASCTACCILPPAYTACIAARCCGPRDGLVQQSRRFGRAATRSGTRRASVTGSTSLRRRDASTVQGDSRAAAPAPACLRIQSLTKASSGNTSGSKKRASGPIPSSVVGSHDDTSAMRWPVSSRVMRSNGTMTPWRSGNRVVPADTPPLPSPVPSVPTPPPLPLLPPPSPLLPACRRDGEPPFVRWAASLSASLPAAAVSMRRVPGLDAGTCGFRYASPTATSHLHAVSTSAFSRITAGVTMTMWRGVRRRRLASDTGDTRHSATKPGAQRRTSDTQCSTAPGGVTTRLGHARGPCLPLPLPSESPPPPLPMSTSSDGADASAASPWDAVPAPAPVPSPLAAAAVPAPAPTASAGAAPAPAPAPAPPSLPPAPCCEAAAGVGRRASSARYISSFTRTAMAAMHVTRLPSPGSSASTALRLQWSSASTHRSASIWYRRSARARGVGRNRRSTDIMSRPRSDDASGPLPAPDVTAGLKITDRTVAHVLCRDCSVRGLRSAPASAGAYAGSPAGGAGMMGFRYGANGPRSRTLCHTVAQNRRTAAAMAAHAGRDDDACSRRRKSLGWDPAPAPASAPAPTPASEATGAAMSTSPSPSVLAPPAMVARRRRSERNTLAHWRATSAPWNTFHSRSWWTSLATLMDSSSTASQCERRRAGCGYRAMVRMNMLLRCRSCSVRRAWAFRLSRWRRPVTRVLRPASGAPLGMARTSVGCAGVDGTTVAAGTVGTSFIGASSVWSRTSTSGSGSAGTTAFASSVAVPVGGAATPPLPLPPPPSIATSASAAAALPLVAAAAASSSWKPWHYG